MRTLIAAAAIAALVATPASAHLSKVEYVEKQVEQQAFDTDEAIIEAVVRAEKEWNRIDREYQEAQAVEVASVQVVAPGGVALCDWSCVLCESGGNPQAWNPAGPYWGLYQFDEGTWIAHGGDPGAYGTAGAAEQHRVAARITYDAWPEC